MSRRSFLIPVLAAVAAAALAVSCVSAAGKEKLETFWYNKVTGESSLTNPMPRSVKDEKSGQYYYVLPRSGESTWEKPKELAWTKVKAKEGEHKGADYYVNQVTQESTWDLPEMFQWMELDRNKKFYFNTVTGESRRERPIEMGFKDEKTGRIYWHDPKTGGSTWKSKHWWTEVPVDEHKDKSLVGKTYWMNEETRETVWEKPADAAWVEWHESVETLHAGEL